MGEHNTLPMELQALTTTVTTPEIYALGTATTGVSFAVIALALLGNHDAYALARLATAPTPVRHEAREAARGLARVDAPEAWPPL